MANTLMVAGRVGAKPELRLFPSGTQVVKFSIAEMSSRKNRDGQPDPTNWFSIEVWGKAADTIMLYVDAGTRLAVTGRIKTDEWTKDGIKQTKMVVVCNDFQILDTKAESEGRAMNVTVERQAPRVDPTPSVSVPEMAAFTGQPTAEEIPF